MTFYLALLPEFRDRKFCILPNNPFQNSEALESAPIRVVFWLAKTQTVLHFKADVMVPHKR